MSVHLYVCMCTCVCIRRARKREFDFQKLGSQAVGSHFGWVLGTENHHFSPLSNLSFPALIFLMKNSTDCESKSLYLVRIIELGSI